MVRIENWKLIRYGEGFQQLKGDVYDHPKFANGTNVTTSYLEAFDPIENYARTLNTEYTLGTPKPEVHAAPTEPRA